MTEHSDDAISAATRLLDELRFDISADGVTRVEDFSPERIRRFFDERSDADLRSILLALADLLADRAQRQAEHDEAVAHVLRALASVMGRLSAPTAADVPSKIREQWHADDGEDDELVAQAVADELAFATRPDGSFEYPDPPDGREWTREEVLHMFRDGRR